MPATSCSTDIPRFWPPVGPNRNNRSWKTSSTWWPSAGFPSAPNAARIRERCGDVAIAFPSDEGRKTKWHCALVRAVSRLISTLLPGPGVGMSADAARKSACATSEECAPGIALLDHLFLAKPVDKKVADHTDLVRELEAGGTQVLVGRLIGGGEIAHGQRVVVVRVHFSVANHHCREVFAFEGAHHQHVVEG